MLFKTPDLTEKDMEVIERIEVVRKTLGVAMGSKKFWTGTLRRMTIAKAIMGSVTIEGYNVTEDDAMVAADNEVPIDPKTEAWMALSGYRAALTYILQLSDDPYFSYSTGLLRSLHFIMVGFDLSKHPGRWRPGPIFVKREETGEIVYEGPDIELMPGLMDELMISLNDKRDNTPGIVRAAMGHLNLVMIHPFSDGNGRMARGLQTLIMARRGMSAPEFSSIEEYLRAHTNEYYQVLGEVGGKNWNPSRDATPWVRFCLTAQFRQATLAMRRSGFIEQLWNKLEDAIKKKGLPERCILALADAAVGYKVRNSTYRTAAEISDQVASRDLRELVKAKLLVPSGEKRGRTYIASQHVIDMRRGIRAPKADEDPYRDELPFLPGLAP